MTTLNRPVRRALPDGVGSRRGLIVGLEPPGIITFRERGTRRTYSLGLGALFIRAVMAEVDAGRKAKRKRGRR